MFSFKNKKIPLHITSVIRHILNS